MSKFNKKVNNRTENLAGGKAYKLNPKMKLVTMLLTSFVSEQYYKSEEQFIFDLKKLLDDLSDKKFMAKSAIYARNEFGMRSVVHIVAGEIAKNVKKQNWTKKFFTKIVRRVDDITEILSYYISNYGKRPIPNALKKGLSKAFDMFDKYQLAKYKSSNREFSLIDAVNLLHPKPTIKNKQALKDLVDGKLRSTDTWEAKMCKVGQDPKDEKEKEELKAKVWKDLISERKIGYFALLRNLRNIIQQSPEIIDKTCELLCNKNLIKKSLVLPFRYAVAYQQIKVLESDSNTRMVMQSISKAVDISLNNIPKFEGKTLVVCDYSGSMGEGLDSYRGKATLFGMSLAKIVDADFMIFGDIASYINYNSLDSTLTLVEQTNEYNNYGGKYCVGHGTNFSSIFRCCNRAYDRIFIFSDMQSWLDGGDHIKTYDSYKKTCHCNPYIYSIDLAGYGTVQFPENNIFCLSGFSEKIFDIMKLLEQDRNALINEIDKIEL